MAHSVIPERPPARGPTDPRYDDPRDLESELRRQFDACHNCRMCVNYCGSFPEMFLRVDRDIAQGAEGAERLGRDDFARVSDLCFQCKLCYIKCPYTEDEGHAWQLDIPRLLQREKAHRAQREGISLVDRALGEPGSLGGLLSGPLAPMANLVHASRLVRKAMEKTAGISAEFLLPPFGSVSFETWLKKHKPLPHAGDKGTVALFATCLGDYNFPQVAANAVRVLEHNGYRVTRPEQVCCGIPNLDGGDVSRAVEKAKANVVSLSACVRRGEPIVALQPTCSYVLRKEYPDLLGTADATLVAEHTLDVMEFLDRARKEKHLNVAFTAGLGKVAYHAACHLRAQKIGFPGARLLGLLPNTEVETIERCSAVDGTWGMKAEFYEMGRTIAQKLTRAVAASEADVVVTDCSLSRRRIEKENDVIPLHPVEALAKGYGIYETVGNS